MSEIKTGKLCCSECLHMNSLNIEKCECGCGQNFINLNCKATRNKIMIDVCTSHILNSIGYYGISNDLYFRFYIGEFNMFNCKLFTKKLIFKTVRC
ncbi:hypothetical protein M0R19_08910 [Candidatus Pacearchaeota archaeon]|nr:hypothetical protein [Candidatus Pacearchaeota archaeon]